VALNAASSPPPGGQECIAAGPDLWFEGLGFPHPVDACQGPRPVSLLNVARWRPQQDLGRRQAASCCCGRRRVQTRLFVNGHGGDQKHGAKRQMKLFSRLTMVGMTATTLFAGAGAALAEIGQPSDWQIGMQESVTPVMDDITSFNTFLFWITTGIALFVLILLGIIIVRFNARAHPVPSRTTHNTVLEILWTIVPVIILATIAVPSFRLLFLELDVPKADLTVKATGKQWLWTYSYPDNGNFEFNSTYVADKDLKPGQPRLLTVDNEMVVPVNKIVHVLVTGADVIHSFAVPSFGIRIDAIPGRINDTWFKATREGTYYGQCSELCGIDHSFMPIVVHVESEADFNAWVTQQKQQNSADNAGSQKSFATADAPAQ
jgi:cytochrome c oxidase subunit II